MNDFLVQKAYNSDTLVKDILSNMTNLSTIAVMNSIRGIDRKVNRFVTKLELSGNSIDQLDKFPNVEEILLHIRSSDMETPEYKAILIGRPNIKVVIMETGIINNKLPQYVLPDKCDTLDYFNIDDIITYDRDRNTATYYDSPFANKGTYHLLFDGFWDKMIHFDVFTNSPTMISRLRSEQISKYGVFPQRVNGEANITILPLDDSQYSDYVSVLHLIEKDKIDPRPKYDAFDFVGFDDFEDDQSYLFNDKGEQIFVILNEKLKLNPNLESIYGKINEKNEYISLFERISLHPDSEKIIAKYRVYRDAIDRSSIFVEKERRAYLETLSALIPITLMDVGYCDSESIKIIMDAGLLDLSQSFENNEYMPYIGRFALIEIKKHPKIDKRIAEIYPEYRFRS